VTPREARNMQELHGSSIELPSQKYQPTESEQADRPGVLIVDPDHWLRVMLQLGLERNGFDVWCASNDVEAIDLYLQFGLLIDVVVLDISTPDSSGPRTLEGLRNLNPDVLVFFMIGENGASDLEAWPGRGTGCFITKPFYVDKLAEVLRPLASSDLRPCGTVNKRFASERTLRQELSETHDPGSG
jgi:DNA-binding response OmpR family regulator